MLQIPFKWLEFAFECFESLSNSLKLQSNASNPFRVVQISIRIPFKWFEFAFECFESILNGYNFSFEFLQCHSKGSNLIRML